MSNAPSLKKIELAVAAIAAIESRGEKVTARNVAGECGWYVSEYSGLNGRDADAYREAMQQSGYVRVEHGGSVRYARPHAAVRPSGYPTRYELDARWAGFEGVRIEKEKAWPKDPPFCVACGEEMLTVGDLTQEGRPERHAEEALNPRHAIVEDLP